MISSISIYFCILLYFSLHFRIIPCSSVYVLIYPDRFSNFILYSNLNLNQCLMLSYQLHYGYLYLYQSPYLQSQCLYYVDVYLKAFNYAFS